ncbi:uncharacterized protein EHS24_004399 [Apiotrichum porosum]|uniref:NADH dehydrogenase [ubiquinone] iron-sulfur protein 5 n=1 Tax=Apiotrichum porosum TaxID=105984 RepID=A0A427Y501_9TREE|nr:uncharacterized protein EHS24_004399 [Apiotrichum porosum]RSH86168.1 hypothetical protein EHS24_004399 [Apiotrichum porosum]
MASGFGYTGGRTRCFAFWQEFSKVGGAGMYKPTNSVQCYASAEGPNDCIAQKEDYLECLHRTKEIARAKEIKTHFVQTQAREGADARKAAEKAATGVIVNLGLVEESS